jgi:hypothetical protein
VLSITKTPYFFTKSWLISRAAHPEYLRLKPAQIYCS